MYYRYSMTPFQRESQCYRYTTKSCCSSVLFAGSSTRKTYLCSIHVLPVRNLHGTKLFSSTESSVVRNIRYQPLLCDGAFRVYRYNRLAFLLIRETY
jgi:hypothetical protein